MEFEKGWLIRQCEAAAKEVATWPEWKRKAYELYITPEPMSDREYTMRHEDSQKYGNY